MNRRGIALLSALSLLALLGLLVAGAVASASIAQRASRLALMDGPLAADADYALAAVLANSASYHLEDLPLGAASTLDVALPSGDGVRATVGVTRLPNGLLWLVASSSISGAERGSRRVNLIARFPLAFSPPAAPIVARSVATLAPDVVVLSDSSGDADCFAAPSTVPVQTADSSVVFATARQLALLDSAPGVVHVRGDTTIVGGSLTGILLVDGILTVDGPFTLTGLAIANAIRSTRGFSVVGAVVGQAVGATPSVDLAGATIRYSPCTVSRSFRAAGAPRAVRGRAWSELF